MGSHCNGSDAETRALSTFICLTRAGQAISNRLHQSLRVHNLTTSQLGVLEVLLHLGPLTQREIGKKILKTSGNMTLVIDNLEKRGLVKRDRLKGDRRCNRIVLTNPGAKLISKIFPLHVQEVSKAFSVLSVSELNTLRSLCKKLGKSSVSTINNDVES